MRSFTSSPAAALPCGRRPDSAPPPPPIARRSHRARRVPLTPPAAEAATGAAGVALGGSGVAISPLGIGTRGWGDTTAGYGDTYDDEDLSLVFETAIAGGCTFFDTDEMFGFQSLAQGQHAEQSLGKLAKLWDHPARPPIVIGTKYCPLPWANSFIGGGVRSTDTESMIAALDGSLKRLGRQQVDLYYLQNPIDGNAKAYMESFARARDSGLVKAFGVSNHSKEQLEGALEEAHKLELPLAAAQVRYSIFSREPERDGVLDICAREGLAVIAHSPLDGRLGGGPEAVSKDEGSVLKLLEFIGAVGYKGKTSTQIALNYLISKGAVPIPGCTKVEHAEEALGVLGWSLDADDVQTIDEKLTYHGCLTRGTACPALQIALNYLISKGAVPIPGCTKVEHAEEALGVLGWSLDAEDVQTIDEKLTYHGY